MSRGSLTLLVDWNLAAHTGWGNYGIHLTAAALRRGHRVVLLAPPDVSGMTPQQAHALAPALRTWPEVERLFRSVTPGHGVHLPGVRLRAFGNAFTGSTTPIPVEGDTDVGLVFFEEETMPPAALATARRCRTIIAGSSWNARVLQAHGLTNVTYVMQGVDTSVFHPGPRTGMLGGRFIVFSGGKLEHRKGQDLVIAAYREFHRRHPEALLVHAWHNAWPQTAMEIARRGLVAGPPPVRDGRLDLAAWLEANGVPAGAHLEVPPLPNAMLGPIYRDADVAVFPNRCEGGTNLVAMECIASGVPVIVADATGQSDLAAIPGVHAIPAPPLPDEAERAAGRREWGEVRVADLVATMRTIHADRAAARTRARMAAEWMARHDWGTQMAAVLDAVEAAAVNLPPAGADTALRQPALRAAGDA